MLARLFLIPLVMLASALCGTLTAMCNAPRPPDAPITRAPSVTPTDFVTVPPSVTPSATPTHTDAPTLTPTLTLTPTETISPTRTDVPPTETRIPTTTPGRPKTLPETGAPRDDGILLILVVGVALLVLGLEAFLASRNNDSW